MWAIVSEEEVEGNARGGEKGEMYGLGAGGFLASGQAGS